MAGYADGERAVNGIYTDFSKTCNNLIHIEHYCLDQWEGRWVKAVWMSRLPGQWLKGQALQRLITRAGSWASLICHLYLIVEFPDDTKVG